MLSPTDPLSAINLGGRADLMDAVKEGTIKSGESGRTARKINLVNLSIRFVADAQVIKFNETKRRAEEAAEAAAAAARSARSAHLHLPAPMKSLSGPKLKKNLPHGSTKEANKEAKKQNKGAAKSADVEASTKMNIRLLRPSRQRCVKNIWRYIDTSGFTSCSAGASVRARGGTSARMCTVIRKTNPAAALAAMAVGMAVATALVQLCRMYTQRWLWKKHSCQAFE